MIHNTPAAPLASADVHQGRVSYCCGCKASRIPSDTGGCLQRVCNLTPEVVTPARSNFLSLT